MSSTSKIITAIIIAAIIIAGAVVWAGKNKENSDVVSTPTENEEVVPNPVPSPTPTPQTPSPTPPQEPVSFETALPTGNWVVWRVTLDNKTADLNVNVEQALTLQFNTKTKKITGFAGCNTFNGSYTTGTGTKISFGTLASTKKACPALSLETNIFQAMSKITNYSIKGTQLVLSSDDSSTELVYDQAK